MSMAHTAVSTDWLAAHRGEVKLLDASWYMPDDKRDAKAEFEDGHIPGAVFYDLDALSDPATSLPHMLPAPETFARDIGALGIGDDDMVVVYDGAGLFSAARIWWMLRVMGHDRAAVLDGGLPKWKAEGRAAGNRRRRTQTGTIPFPSRCRTSEKLPRHAGSLGQNPDFRCA